MQIVRFFAAVVSASHITIGNKTLERSTHRTDFISIVQYYFIHALVSMIFDFTELIACTNHNIVLLN